MIPPRASSIGGRSPAIWRIILGLLLGISATSAFSGTLYKCRAYSGGSFWSGTACDARLAAIESRRTVPDGMSLKEQIKFVEQAEKQSNTERASETKEFERRKKCGSIDDELNQIQNRYSNGQYVPVDQVNADQKRTRDLKSQRSANRCYQ